MWAAHTGAQSTSAVQVRTGLFEQRSPSREQPYDPLSYHPPVDLDPMFQSDVCIPSVPMSI